MKETDNQSCRFPRYTIERYMAFPKQNTWIFISFDLNTVLTRQTSEKVAYKLSLDYLLECFLPCTSVLPESSALCPKNLKTFLNRGGGAAPPLPPGPYSYD